MPIMIDSPSPPERFSTRATSAMTKKEEEVPGIPPPSLNMKEAVKKCKLTAVTRSACIDSEYKNGFQRIGIKKEHTTSSTENVTTLLHPSSIVQQAAGICKDLRPPSMTSDATTIINNPVSISPSDIDFKSEEQVEPSAIERDSVIAKEEERLSNASENENYDENPGMFVKAEIDHEVENGYVDIEV